MTHKLLGALALAACAGAAFSQSQIGSVTNVQGLVTVSDAATVNTVVQGTPVMNGTRFVTSSTGSATLLVNRNCTINLGPNQSLTLEENKSCPQLLALIQTLPAPVVASTGSNLLLPAIGLAAVGAALAAGSGGSGAAAGGGGGGGQLPNLSGQ